MRILFTVIPEKGHLNPYIPVAQELQRRGHSVAFYSAADVSPQLARAGIRTFLGPQAPAGTSSDSKTGDVSRGKSFAENVRDRLWLRNWIKELLIERVPEQLPLMRRAMVGFNPDLVVSDPMLYASIIVAESDRIPWASVSNSLNPVLDGKLGSELLATVDWLQADRFELFRRYGISHLDFSGCDCLSPHLTTCFTTREFVGRDVPGVALVGPSISREPRGDEPDWPHGFRDSGARKIYASFGSQIYYQPERFLKLIAALGGRPEYQLILSLADLHGSGELGVLPENVISAPYVPQNYILSKVDLFLTHGGANSLMEALTAGVRTIVAPICNDQPHQAAFLVRSGAGASMDMDNLTSEQIREEIEECLQSEDIGQNLARVHASYQVDGAANLAELIEARF